MGVIKKKKDTHLCFSLMHKRHDRETQVSRKEQRKHKRDERQLEIGDLSGLYWSTGKMDLINKNCSLKRGTCHYGDPWFFFFS